MIKYFASCFCHLFSSASFKCETKINNSSFPYPPQAPSQLWTQQALGALLWEDVNFKALDMVSILRSPFRRCIELRPKPAEEAPVCAAAGAWSLMLRGCAAERWCTEHSPCSPQFAPPQRDVSLETTKKNWLQNLCFISQELCDGQEKYSWIPSESFVFWPLTLSHFSCLTMTAVCFPLWGSWYLA